MIKTSLITEGSSNILLLEFVQLAFIYLPMVSLLLIILGKRIKSVCQLSGQIREPSEPSISVNRSREADRPEMAVNQLQVPLLNVGFQYTL